jgi:L-lysine exporter family protein LysE/ArgO
MLSSVFFKGIGLGGSLIIAIGAQNAFLLKQGLQGRHVLLCAAVCMGCDIVLIGLGVSSVGRVVASNAALLGLIRVAGALFLFEYGRRAAWAAWRPGAADPLAPGGLAEAGRTAQGAGLCGLVAPGAATFATGPGGAAVSAPAPLAVSAKASAAAPARASAALTQRGPALRTALALSLLNPHAWLDTVVLLGAIGAQQPGEAGRYVFAAGAMSASLLWFSCLGLGARLLAPLFALPHAWRVLDGLIAATMWGIALSLVWP